MESDNSRAMEKYLGFICKLVEFTLPVSNHGYLRNSILKNLIKAGIVSVKLWILSL